MRSTTSGIYVSQPSRPRHQLPVEIDTRRPGPHWSRTSRSSRRRAPRDGRMPRERARDEKRRHRRRADEEQFAHGGTPPLPVRRRLVQISSSPPAQVALRAFSPNRYGITVQCSSCSGFELEGARVDLADLGEAGDRARVRVMPAMIHCPAALMPSRVSVARQRRRDPVAHRGAVADDGRAGDHHAEHLAGGVAGRARLSVERLAGRSSMGMSSRAAPATRRFDSRPRGPNSPADGSPVERILDERSRPVGRVLDAPRRWPSGQSPRPRRTAGGRSPRRGHTRYCWRRGRRSARARRRRGRGSRRNRDRAGYQTDPYRRSSRPEPGRRAPPAVVGCGSTPSR